ncbi:hypothetical protein [Desulforamulus hydrothermalis]|uniref:Uncharacterized protein n=1 Tax=Desulforamulus hydrothermalis Lam5 = DSM 18033 TaxID=1121428 RepID=K8E050_9FIRM|nr:hypothetical protein [Desulforamulus hydrothermalis]CCO08847.1 conserved hypothetical protein [Desulforamulus hydrothermalis Lam5 = DSM 18033]SHG73095.1 hypothetical protein SAMN02745177_00162 [Desulforamulus hydrothermalis Lam5 = DSM 18033]
MNLNMTANHDFELAQEVNDFVNARLESLHPAAMPEEAVKAINRLEKLLEGIDFTILSNMTFDEVREFQAIDDIISMAFHQQYKNAYRLGFCDGVKLILGILQEE